MDLKGYDNRLNNFTFTEEGINKYFTNRGYYGWHRLITSSDKNNNLYINGRLIVPIERKTQLLNYIYDNKLTLPSIQPFYDYVKTKYYGISYSDVENYIKSKPEWQFNHNVSRKSLMPVIYYSPGHFQIDLTIIRKKFIPGEINILLNGIDIYSHYAFSVPLKSKDSISTANAIRPYLRYFKSIQTDNGTEFRGEFHNLLVKHKIPHIFSMPYRWETQGLIERFNGTIKRYIKMDIIKELPRRFTLTDAILQKYVKAYNHTKQKTLGGYTPYEMFAINNLEMYNSRLNQINKKLEQYKRRDKKLYIGDKVRISIPRSKTGAKLKPQNLFKYSRDVYTITDIINPKEPWQLIKYMLNNGAIYNGSRLLKIPQ